MKPYDLVISNSLAELIETTNEAYTYGYLPVGGMIYIESQEKFIQTIIKLKPQKTMNTFFQELAKAMKDSEIITLRITKVGEDLTVLAIQKGKIDTAYAGTPEELDTELIIELLKPPVKTEKKGLVITPVTESENEEEEKEEEEETETDKKGAAGKESKEKGKAGKEKTSKKSKSKDVDDSKMTELKEGPGNESSTISKTETVAEDKHPNATAAIAKAHEEGAKATEAKKEASKAEARKDNEFLIVMHEGKRLFADTKLGGDRYALALEQFNKAKELKPGDADAIQEANKAEKWVNAMSDL